MFYSDDIVEQVRSANNIVDVISSYVKLQKKGNSYFGLCPFHNEKSPSFSVSPDKQMYYCFGCGAGGNIFTFLMEYENFTFPEALKFLADRAGITLPEGEDLGEARREADLRSKVFEVNKEAAKYYYALLNSERGRTGKKYLLDRGLSEETIKSFGLGYSDKYPDDLYRYLKSKDYPDNVLRESGLFTYDEKKGFSDKFWNRVMFPIMDINNKVIAFGGRVMGDAKPKYLNSPETRIFDKSRNLYGLNAARRSRDKKMILCEGYMDVISLHQAGFTTAVASLGTAFTPGQASLLKRYAQEVYLVYDSDGAGEKAILRALPILRSTGLDARVVSLSPYKDPDEFIKSMGREAFSERLDKASNGFLFSLRVEEKDYDMTSPEGRTRFFKVAAERLLMFEEELERNNYIQAVADQYMISAGDLKKLVNQLAMKGVTLPKNYEEEAPKKKQKKPEDGTIKACKLLLTWLIEYPKVFKTVREYIYPSDFATDMYRKVATLLYEQESEGEMVPARIISCFESEEEQHQVAELFNSYLPEETDRKELGKAIKEAMVKIKRAGVDHLSENIDPCDMGSMQDLIASRRALQNLEKLNISVE